jgi:hypothetical protein
MLWYLKKMYDWLTLKISEKRLSAKSNIQPHRLRLKSKKKINGT